ncbi:hypothetical protein KAR48_12485 [bacterium]|nr:hypothetical protein [bacterium]
MTIINNNADENPFSIAIEGTGEGNLPMDLHSLPGTYVIILKTVEGVKIQKVVKQPLRSTVTSTIFEVRSCSKRI